MSASAIPRQIEGPAGCDSGGAPHTHTHKHATTTFASHFATAPLRAHQHAHTNTPPAARFEHTPRPFATAAGLRAKPRPEARSLAAAKETHAPPSSSRARAHAAGACHRRAAGRIGPLWLGIRSSPHGVDQGLWRGGSDQSWAALAQVWTCFYPGAGFHRIRPKVRPNLGRLRPKLGRVPHNVGRARVRLPVSGFDQMPVSGSTALASGSIGCWSASTERWRPHTGAERDTSRARLDQMWATMGQHRPNLDGVIAAGSTLRLLFEFRCGSDTLGAILAQRRVAQA